MKLLAKVILFLFFAVGLCFHNNAQENNVIYFNHAEVSEMTWIGKGLLFLEDSSNTLELDDILLRSHQLSFKKYEKDLFTKPASYSAYWFKITTQNLSDEDLWLEIGNSYYCWEIDFYSPNESGGYYPPQQLGYLRPNQNNSFNSHHYAVQLAKSNEQSIKTHYLKIVGNTAKFYPLKIGSTKAVTTQINKYDFAAAIFIGIIIVMILYNLFVWFSVKDISYLYYIIYLIYILFLIPHINGYPFFEHRFFVYYSFVWNAIGYIIPALFAFEYLKMKQNAKGLYYWILAVTFTLGVIFPIINIFQLVDFLLMYNISATVSLTYNISLFIVGIYVLIRGYKNARYYVLGWTFVVITMIVFFLTLLLVVPYNSFTSNITYIGFSAEAILFAFALGDRINTLKEEKEYAQNQNIKLIKEQASILEENVEERTKQLKKAKDEITLQNEEIKQLNEDLEKKIHESTRILVEQNEKLKEYAFMNAHKVRGPLARILGLTVILDLEEVEPKIKDYLEKLNVNAHELDVIIRDMNRILEDSSFFEED